MKAIFSSNVLTALWCCSIWFLSGCASVPMADKEHDRQAKEFSTKSDMSNIYIYVKAGSNGTALTWYLVIDGLAAGGLTVGDFAKFEVKPGIHQVSIDERRSIAIETEAGYSYFYKLDEGRGTIQFDETTGRNGVAECKLIMIPESVSHAIANKSVPPTKKAVLKAQQLALETLEKEQQNKVTAELKTYISKNDMHGLSVLIDAHPDVLASIEDTRVRLLLTGPAKLRIIDVEKLAKNGTKDSLIIAKINSTSLPYKDFTADEMIALKKMSISDDVVAAMIAATTEYDKEQKKQAEQKRVLAEQQAAAQQLQQQQIQVAQAPASESNTPAECVKLVAALKACDQAGGFLAMGCKSLAKSKFDCPTVAQYMR